ncbi:MAG: lactate utilization protein [Candidatus Moraniibacteriota bacterium]
MSNSKWEKIPTKAVIKKVIENLKNRNISAEIVDDQTQALDRLKELIPAGVSLMTGSSTTLDQIGFSEFLKSGKHSWKNLKEEVLAEEDLTKQNELRRKSVLADYFLGSIHAITKDGVVLDASATGSQLPSYAFTSPHVIWVVGAHKITENLEDAFTRLGEYVFPLEDQRMKNSDYAGSVIGKILLVEKEFVPNRIHIIFVRQILGF